MANELKFGSKVVFLNGEPLTLPIAATDPGSAVAGDFYYNSADSSVRVYNGTAWVSLGSGSGDVTSVGLAEGAEGGDQTIFTISNSPITSSGNISLSLASQAENLVLASPNGSSGQPSFRALAAADIPSLSSVYLPLSGGTLSGALNLGGNQINDLASPSVSTDAVNKAYVDAAINGLSWKGPVAAYANSNVALTGSTPLVIDGYTVQNSDLLLLGNQTTAADNGEYTAAISGGTYTLTITTFPSAAGEAWLVLNGTDYADSAFVSTAAIPAAAFVEFAGPSAYSFVAPLSLSGNTVNLNWGNGLTLNGGSPNTLEVLAADASISVTGSGIAISLASSNSALQVTGGLLVNVDGITIDVNGGNALEVKAGGIADAQISASAAIARSKIAAGTDYAWVTNSSAGVLQDTSVTASSAVATDANGLPVASSTTATELGYVSGVTSAIQTQINGLANQALSNLASTAINVDLIPGTTALSNLGSPSKVWHELFVGSISSEGGTLGLSSDNGLITIQSGTSATQVSGLSFQRSSDNTNFVTEVYNDGLNLTDNSSSPVTVTAFSFPYASIAGQEIVYVIETGTASVDTRIGTIRVVCQNQSSPTPSLSDTYTETADCGVVWSAVVSGANVLIQYTSTDQGFNRNMNADVKSFIR